MKEITKEFLFKNGFVIFDWDDPSCPTKRYVLKGKQDIIAFWRRDGSKDKKILFSISATFMDIETFNSTIIEGHQAFRFDPFHYSKNKYTEQQIINLIDLFKYHD